VFYQEVILEFKWPQMPQNVAHVMYLPNYGDRRKLLNYPQGIPKYGNRNISVKLSFERWKRRKCLILCPRFIRKEMKLLNL
jgi:hypothetical protein